jgi:hypothetical protein
LTDIISFAQFEEELRRIARFDAGDPIVNPLAAVVQRITENPHLAQARLLGRMLKALAHGCGEFRRAEACAFDKATLKLVIAVMNAAHAGTNTRAEWLDAIASVKTAATQ